MQYMGSKSKITKYIVPIIQSYIKPNMGYLEICVGGANVIDKIKANKKIGCDIHKQLIELLKYVQNLNNKLPKTITEKEYNMVKFNKDNYDDWYIGLVGFCGSFGAKYFGGFARRYNKDGSLFDVPEKAIETLEKQRINIQDIEFRHYDFINLPKEKIKNYVIYCDIPYKRTTKYSTKDFPYDEFYEWCEEMSWDNTILVSEYSMPKTFTCIWSKEVKNSIGSGINKTNNKRTEKLFILT